MRGKLPALLTVAIMMGACSKAPEKKTPPPQKANYVLPEQREVLEYEDLPGRVEAVNDVDIKARVEGLLTKVHFQEGTEVKKGDLLFSIDPRQYQAEYDSAIANWQQAKAREAQAASDLERAKQLSKNTVIAKQELEIKGTDVLAAEGVVKSAQAEVNKAQLNLEYTEIRAPIDGKISRTNVTEGNLVRNGDSLTSIVSQAPVYVYVEAPERAVLRWDALIKDGSLATKAKISVGLLNEEGFPREGRVDFADNELNTGTGTLRLRAVVENQDRILRVGMYARVRLAIDQPKNVLLVPERAVGIDQGRRFVYTINKDNKIEYRTVKVGQVFDGKLAVLKGISAEDRVVTEGIQYLRPDQTVEPIQAPATQAARVEKTESPS